MKEYAPLFRRIQSYLPSHGITIGVQTVYISPAQQLRNQADRIEQQEKDEVEFEKFIRLLES
jgi:hypothetical protein